MTADVTLRVHANVAAAAADLDQAGLAGYAFQCASWLGAYQETLGTAAGSRPAIVVAVADGQVRMVLPLAVTCRRGIRSVEFLGGIVTDYNAPRIDPGFAARLDPAAMALLWSRLSAALPPHDVVRLVRMPASLDPPPGHDGAIANPLVRLPGIRPDGRARSLALSDDHAALMAARRSKFVSDNRRRWRRLSEKGVVSFDVAGTDEATGRILAALKPMKSRRWRDTASDDHFADPAFAAFHDRLAAMAIPDGRVHASMLSVGSAPVAAHLGLVHRGRFYLLMTAWASGAWERFSPGRLFCDALIRRACEDGLATFDFTVGEEAYKAEWVDTELPLFAYEAATTLRGRCALALARQWRGVREAAKRVAWLRGAVRRLHGRPPLPPPGSPA